jgi:hypothetical protein
MPFIHRMTTEGRVGFCWSASQAGRLLTRPSHRSAAASVARPFCKPCNGVVNSTTAFSQRSLAGGTQASLRPLTARSSSSSSASRRPPRRGTPARDCCASGAETEPDRGAGVIYWRRSEDGQPHVRPGEFRPVLPPAETRHRSLSSSNGLGRPGAGGAREEGGRRTTATGDETAHRHGMNGTW